MSGWRSQSVSVPVRMDAVRRMWRRAPRIDGHCSARLGTRNTTISLGSLDDPIGWCAIRWRPYGEDMGTIHRIAWNNPAGRTPADVWRAIADLAGTPALSIAPDLRLNTSAA